MRTMRGSVVLQGRGRIYAKRAELQELERKRSTAAADDGSDAHD